MQLRQPEYRGVIGLKALGSFPVVQGIRVKRLGAYGFGDLGFGDSVLRVEVRWFTVSKGLGFTPY